MIPKLGCIMLIDDNKDDNFFHERVIMKSGYTKCVVSKQTAREGLEHLKAKNQHPEKHPELIFLDINMPGMNGWEFLEEFKRLDKEFQSKGIVVMLTTSDKPEDKKKALELGLPCDFKTKPLSQEMLKEILEKYYK